MSPVVNRVGDVESLALAGTSEIVMLQTNSPAAPGSSAITAPLAVIFPAAV